MGDLRSAFHLTGRVAVLAAVALVAANARAQESAEPLPTGASDFPSASLTLDDAPGPSDPGAWSFHATPYGWAIGLDGALGVRGISATFDVDFSELFDHLEFGGMLHLEGRKDRLILFGDLTYVKIGGSTADQRGLADAFDLGTLLSDVELNVPTPQPMGSLPPPVHAIVKQLIADAVTQVKQEVIDVLEAVTPGPRLDTVDYDLELTIAEVGAGLHLGDWELGGAGAPDAEMDESSGSLCSFTSGSNLSADLLVGVRYFNMEIDIGLGITPGALNIVPARVTKSQRKDWVDPFFGGRLALSLSDGHALFLSGDVGGFGVGSDLTWNLVAGSRWRLRHNIELDLGYRILDIDYEDGSGEDRFAFDGQLSGPVLGLTIRF